MMEIDNNNKGLVILLIVFILMVLSLGGWVMYDKYFANKTPSEPVVETPKEDNEEIYDDILSEYGILSYGELNPFKNLDFSNKEYGGYVKLDNNVIKYSSEETGQKVSIPVDDVIQVGTNCSCGGCISIYYLKSNGELFSIELDHGWLDEEYEVKSIATNVESFIMFEEGIVESTTCGGQDLIVKYNDGTIKINGYDLSLLERYWIFEAGYEHDLFIVSKNAKVKTYLTNELGEKLIAKQVFITQGENSNGVYVIDENDYMYYVADFTMAKLNKYNESKVKSIKENNDNITVTYDNNSTEVIDTVLVYDYNKDYTVEHEDVVDTTYEQVKKFATTGIYYELSFILDNTFQQRWHNNVSVTGDALKINGNILEDEDYKLEFAFQFGNIYKYKTLIGEEVTEETGAYWLTKKDYDEVYKRVYGTNPNYDESKYIEDGYYKTGVFTGYTLDDEYRFVEISNKKDSSGVITSVAKIYDNLYNCEYEDNNDEEFCETHGKEIGKLEIKYKMNNKDYVIKSISVYEK